MKNLTKKEDKVSADVEKAYQQALKELDALLADTYIAMMEDGGITPANLYKYNRYEALQSTITKLAGYLGRAEENIVANFLIDLYKEEYKKYAEQAFNISFTEVSEDLVRNAVQTNWSGEHFSSRIWKNKNALVEQLNTILINGVALGISREKMSRELARRFQVGHSNADRLIRTESMFIYNRTHFDVYEKNGILQYEFLAEIDGRTSDMCRALNGKKFYLVEAQVGQNYPPVHVRCRSTVMPVLNNKGE